MRINPDVRDCATAPIAEAWSWVRDRTSEGLIDVCQAVPADLPAPELRNYLAEAIAAGEGATYTDIAGIAPLREALARDIQNRYGCDANASDVVITAGCNQAFCATIDGLCGTGDEVIVTLPCYFNHEMWLKIRGIKARHLPLNPQTAVPDPEQVKRLVSARTKAIALITPNNPTGAIYSAHTIERFYGLASEFNLALIIDETYRDFMDESAVPHRLFEQPGWRDTFVHLYSFSKAYSLAGYRVGAIVAGPAMLDSLIKIQDCTAICAPHVGQLAALYGVRHLQQWKRDVCGELVQRAQAIKDAFNNPALDYTLVSAGAYFAYVQHPFDQPAHEVAKRLAQEFGVICLPGSYFGSGQEQYLRLAFANLKESYFPELINRLIASQT